MGKSCCGTVSRSFRSFWLVEYYTVTVSLQNMALNNDDQFLLYYRSQIKITITGMFNLDQDVSQFKEHLRDFLVQIKVSTASKVPAIFDIGELEGGKEGSQFFSKGLGWFSLHQWNLEGKKGILGSCLTFVAQGRHFLQWCVRHCFDSRCLRWDPTGSRFDYALFGLPVPCSD